MPKKKKVASKRLHCTKNNRRANKSKLKPTHTHKSHQLKIVTAVSISPPIDEKIKLPRKRRCKNGANRMYFTQDTEDAIITYNKEENLEVREQIFQSRIHYAFQKLVENIFNTFKFSYFETGPQDVQKECLTHLVSNIHKFDPTRTSKLDPTKKAKAFAYFSIIAKHYLILLNNNNYKKFNQNVEISEERDEHTVQLQAHDNYYAKQEMSDFIRLIVEFWEKNIDKIFTKQRDLNIANAVVELIRNSNKLEVFNKKAIYLMIRDIADCHTQQITKIINKMKLHQKMLYASYRDVGDVNTNRYSTS